MFRTTTIPVLEQVAAFTQARHQVLAGNVANLDTPGYRVRDLSVDAFRERLREAIAAREAYDPAASSGVLQREPDDAMRHVRDSMQGILYHDDSNVGMEQQVLELSKNHSLHNMAISIMVQQFHLLQAAITERV